jgi:hypothetical protein
MVESDRRATRWDTWDRYSPYTGIVAVLLWLLGVIVLEGAASAPGEDAAAADFARFYDEDGGTILGAGTTFAIGSLFFLWFLGTLRVALLAAEGGYGRITGVAYAGGLATGIFSLCMMAPDFAGAIQYEVDGETLEPAAAQAIGSLSDGFFVLAEYSAALFLVAVALVALRTRVLPAWLAWISLVVGVLMLIPPIGWAGLIFVFPLWIVVVSVLLAMRRAPDEPVVRDAVL